MTLRTNDIENRSGLVHGNRRGVVLSTDDPLEAGRVKVRVFSVYDDFRDEDIPWAIYADPFMGGSENKGGLFVPDEGDLVWVFFEEGDPQQPVYFAGAPARPHFPSNKSKSYPRNKVYKTKSGHYLEFTDGGHIELYHSSGNKIELAEGKITTTSSSGSTFTMDDSGNISATAKSNITERASKNSLYENDAGNSIFMDSSSMTFTSASGGYISMGASGTTFTSALGAYIELKESGVTLNDAAGNSLTIGDSGIILSGASGNRFALTDSNQIKATSSNFNE